MFKGAGFGVASSQTDNQQTPQRYPDLYFFVHGAPFSYYAGGASQVASAGDAALKEKPKPVSGWRPARLGKKPGNSNGLFVPGVVGDGQYFRAAMTGKMRDLRREWRVRFAGLTQDR